MPDHIAVGAAGRRAPVCELPAAIRGYGADIEAVARSRVAGPSESSRTCCWRVWTQGAQLVNVAACGRGQRRSLDQIAIDLPVVIG